MSKLLIFILFLTLASCSAEDEKALDDAMNKPAKEMSYGDALFLVSSELSLRSQATRAIATNLTKHK
jgi:hypothetical protein